MSSIETLIGSLGFPIAVSAYLLYERTKSQKEVREDKNKTIEMVTEALTNNTEALAELKGIIERHVD